MNIWNAIKTHPITLAFSPYLFALAAYLRFKQRIATGHTNSYTQLIELLTWFVIGAMAGVLGYRLNQKRAARIIAILGTILCIVYALTFLGILVFGLR